METETAQTCWICTIHVQMHTMMQENPTFSILTVDSFPTLSDNTCNERCIANTMRPRTPTFSQSAKIRMIELGISVTELAARVGSNRTNTSLVIHQSRSMPKLEKKIRKALGL